MRVYALHTQWDEAAFSTAAGDGDTITFDQWALAFRPGIAVSAAPYPTPTPYPKPDPTPTPYPTPKQAVPRRTQLNESTTSAK